MKATTRQAAATVGVTIRPYASQFGQYAGTFPSPFKSRPRLRQVELAAGRRTRSLDFGGNYRREHETRDFGGMTRSSRPRLKNWVYGSTLRHQWNNDKALNQATFSWQTYTIGTADRRSIGTWISGRTSKDHPHRRQSARRRNSTSAGSSCATTSTSRPAVEASTSSRSAATSTSIQYQSTRASTPTRSQVSVDPANDLTFAQPFEAQFGFGNPNLISQQPSTAFTARTPGPWISKPDA